VYVVYLYVWGVCGMCGCRVYVVCMDVECLTGRIERAN
jgi:hypothetical protein